MVHYDMKHLRIPSNQILVYFLIAKSYIYMFYTLGFYDCAVLSFHTVPYIHLLYFTSLRTATWLAG